MFIVFEVLEHVIFPIFWFVFKGKKKSVYGITGMIGKTVEIKKWKLTTGKVLINGELWKAVSETPLQVGDKAIIQEVEGLTLKLTPLKNRSLF